MTKEPFKPHIFDAVLEDLRERLKRTRWPRDFGNNDWRYGTNLEYLRELVDYWINKFDWRSIEAKINSFANCKTEIDGVPNPFARGLPNASLMLNH